MLNILKNNKLYDDYRNVFQDELPENEIEDNFILAFYGKSVNTMLKSIGQNLPEKQLDKIAESIVNKRKRERKLEEILES